MAEQVQQRTGQRRRGAERHAEHDVAHLPDARIGQHAADVVLRHGQDGTRQHGDDRHPAQQRQDLRRSPLGGGHEVQHPEQRVGTDLRHHRGDEAGDRGRGVRVGVRQPAVQREQRRLDRQPDDDQHHRHAISPCIHDVRQPHGHVGHVEGAGQGVQVAGSQQVKRRGDGADNEITERCHRAANTARSQQGVGGQRRDFQEYVQVEQVARQHDAQQAGDEEQVKAVEHAAARRAALVLRTGIHRDAHGDQGDQGRHAAGQRIEDVLDAPRRCPAAQFVAQRAVCQHVRQRRTTGDRGGRQCQARDGERRRRGGQRNERDDDGGGERQDNDQNRQMRRHRRILSRISGSSRVPKCRWMRMSKARATPVVLTPTTMAVSIRACGSGLT